MQTNRKTILILGVSLELLLICIYYAWAGWRDVEISWGPSLSEFALGAVLAFPLLFFNYIIFGPVGQKFAFLEECRRFSSEIIIPFAAQLDLPSAFVISVFAGVGEELFFRACLQTETGIVISSLIFVVLHFGLAVRIFPKVSVLYFLISVYFGISYYFFSSIWIPISAHATYDFIALAAIITARMGRK